MRPVDINPTAPVRAPERVAPTEPARPPQQVAGGEKDVEVSRRELLGGNSAPVDSERVQQIRQALADGSYPLSPAKIADAMIAAKLILRTE